MYFIFKGIVDFDFEIIIMGSYAFADVCVFIFSMYALLLSKHRKDTLHTYGYSRYETLAAFSNCTYLIIYALFLVLGSLHFHSEEEQ